MAAAQAQAQEAPGCSEAQAEPAEPPAAAARRVRRAVGAPPAGFSLQEGAKKAFLFGVGRSSPQDLEDLGRRVLVCSMWHIGWCV